MSFSAHSTSLEWPAGPSTEPCVDLHPEIKSLTTAIAAGDTEAFSRFYREWFDPMLAEARRSTGRDESFCMDVVQDAMMRVIRSLRPMETPDDLRRWVRVVVQTAAYDRLRRESRRRRTEGRALRRRQPSAPQDDLGARLSWLRRQLASMDDRSIQLLLMRHRFGWSLRRIADRLCLKTGAVDGRLRRLHARLRRKAEEDADG